MNPALLRHWMGMRTCGSQRCRFARTWRRWATALGVMAILAGSGCDFRPTHVQNDEGCGAVKDQGPEPAVIAQSPAAAVPASNPPPTDHALLHTGFDPESSCTCATAMLNHRWCWRCNVGYLAGRRIENAQLFEALDPHGHELDNESLQLQACREAIQSDGYCQAIGIGFVAGKAYFTRLTYGVAKGRTIDLQALECAACKAHTAKPEWCETCGLGMVGNVAFDNRDMFDRTAREHEVLLAAIEKAPTCAFCACAMVAHLVCPKCQISYESGVTAAVNTQKGDRDAALEEGWKSEGS